MSMRAIAQQQGFWRIGFLYFGSRQSSLTTGRYTAFVQAMSELGYVEGKNLLIETRFGDGKKEELPALVADLLHSKVQVIVATGSPVYGALRHANATTPVVVTVTADPVSEGLAASLARPGGTFTGLSDYGAELVPKQLELLKTALPKMLRVGVLLNPTNVSHPGQTQGLIVAARKIGVDVVQSVAGTIAGLDTGFASLVRKRADALILFGDTFFVQQFQQIAQSAVNHRMPSISLTHDYAQAGGLMSYGPDLTDNFRRAASYVDKILKGVKAGELPFQQPTRYVLAINVRTAKALGLTVPPALLLRADEVIQ